MSAYFGQRQSWLRRIYIRLVSIRLLVMFLSLVACPCVIPDLNEPAGVEWSDMKGKKPWDVELRPFSVGTYEHALNLHLDEAQTSYIRTSGETDGPTEAIVLEPIPSERQPVVFLSSAEMEVWKKIIKTGKNKSKLPDIALMSIGIGGYPTFRKRHIVVPMVKNHRRIHTLDMAGELMGNIELKSLGLVEDKKKLSLDLGRAWFGEPPEGGWMGKPRNTLLAAEHAIIVALYHIRVLNHVYQPSFLKKEAELKEVQRKSFTSLGVMLHRMTIMPSKQNVQPIQIHEGLARRIGSQLKQSEYASKGQRMALAWSATEYAINEHLRDLYNILPRELSEVHRHLKKVVADQTIASASELRQTKIPQKDQVIINMPFVMPRQTID